MIIAVEDKSYRCKECDSFGQCEYYNHRRPDSHICKEFTNDNKVVEALEKMKSRCAKAETKAYFDGQAYGREEGRKALCDEISAEIEERIAVYDNWQTQRECTATEANTMREALAIVEKYKKEVSE